jgi:hypothetical protein
MNTTPQKINEKQILSNSDNSRIESLNSDIQSLKKSSTRWENGYLFFVVCSVLVAAVTVYFQYTAVRKQSRVAEAQEELLHLKDLKAAEDSKAKDLEIGKVNERAALADERAGKANEAAGKANERAGNLELTAADLTKKNLDTEGKLVDARRELENEKHARIKVERAVASRTIPTVFTGGKSNFEVLKPYKGTNVEFQVIPDWEARRAAFNIAGILEQAGWVIKGFRVVEELEDGVEIESYLSPTRTKAEEDDPLKFSDLLRADAGAERQSFFLATQLEKFLVSSNWEVAVIHKSKRGELSANTIRVNVGLKPTPYDLNPQVQEMKQRMKETMQKVRADQARRDKEMEELQKRLESDPRYQELMKPRPPLVLRPPEEPEKPKE